MATIFEALQPNPEDRLHLRLHRARSVILTSQELVEIRAAQRTFEGAYMRTALGQLAFSLIVLRLFTAEYYPVGALFAVYSMAILLLAIYRRYEGNRQFFDGDPSPPPLPPKSPPTATTATTTTTVKTTAMTRRTTTTAVMTKGGCHDDTMADAAAAAVVSRAETGKKKFRTSGNSVAMLVFLTLSSYIALLVLVFRLNL